MDGLQAGLKRRHVTMIALGGVIGAGLFVGSGAVINQTGPAAVLSYLIAGVLVVLVMRMLGEMAVANPSTGSFADYARLSLGNWAGFTTGWLYWWFWVIVLAGEAVAGAEIIQRWIDIPIWASSLVLMMLLTLTNLWSVRSYGEWTVKINSRGVLARAILLATSVGYISVIFAALWPETIFLWLVNSSGAVALFVYLLIAVSQLRMRARLEREDPEKLQFRMWAYPFLTWAVIVAIVVVIGSMAVVDDVRDQLWWSLGSLAGVLTAAWARSLQPSRSTSRQATTPAASP